MRPAVSVVMPFAGDQDAAQAAATALLALHIGAGDQLILADNSGSDVELEQRCGGGPRRVLVSGERHYDADRRSHQRLPAGDALARRA